MVVFVRFEKSGATYVLVLFSDGKAGDCATTAYKFPGWGDAGENGTNFIALCLIGVGG